MISIPPSSAKDVGGLYRALGVRSDNLYPHETLPDRAARNSPFDLREETFTYADRVDAGQQLSAALRIWQGHKDVVVIGIPRGGMIVAAQVARELGAPLGVWVARKLRGTRAGSAIGSLGEDGELWVDEGALHVMGIPALHLLQEVRCRRAEVAQQAELYRSLWPAPTVEDKHLLVIDDHMATGATMRSALSGLRRHRPRSICVAAPVAGASAIQMVRHEGADATVLQQPRSLGEVSDYYLQFRDLKDADVLQAIAGWRT